MTTLRGAAMDKHKYLVNCLVDWLEKRGMHPELEPQSMGSWRPDLIVRGESELLIGEAKVAHDYRSKVFPSLVGDAILRAQHAMPDAGLLIAFLMKKLNSKAVEDLERYAREYLPGLNWFILDELGAGVACLRGDRSELSYPACVQNSRSRNGAPPIRGGLFSPSGRKLLKILLMPGIDHRYWGGPQKAPKGIGKLAKASGVSQPAVSSLVKRFEDAGYIQRKSGVPMAVRHQELLDDWFYSLKHVDMDAFPVRSMHGDSIEKIIDKIRACYGSQNKPAAIVGHHMACHLHGIGRSSVKSAKIYVSPPNVAIMEELELVGDESPSPSMWLVHRDFDAVRQGSVIADGVPVCDILQCYLDVRSSRARGQEQADYIWDNILMPHFRGAR